MKSWFSKFKLSAALDSGKPLPPAPRNRVQHSEDLRQYEESLTVLHRALKQSAPTDDAPGTLHDSIMNAIGQADHSTTPPVHWPALGWLAAPGLAALLVASLWLFHPPAKPGEPPLAAAGTALDLSEQIAQAPAAAVAPLAEEWERVNLDLQNTAQFLLASLP